MPEEDDDALGQMLGDRLQGTKREGEENEVGDGDESEAESVSDPDAIESASQQKSQSAQITPSAKSTESAGSTESTLKESKGDSEHEAGSKEGTVRSRSPFPLYVTPELKETVQSRFEKFNAQRTLNDEPQVEKHRHFMEGLLRAGLDNSDLEEYVLEEFDEE
jgi:hypothetical protein